MEKTIKISGMSCEHCEKRVQNALELLGGVEIIEISAIEDQAKLKISDNRTIEEVRDAIEEAGYDVLAVVDGI